MMFINKIRKRNRLLIPAVLMLSLCLTGCAFLEDFDLTGSNDSGNYDYIVQPSEDTVKEPVERTVEEILGIAPSEEVEETSEETSDEITEENTADAEQEEQTDAAAEEPEKEQVQFHFRSKKLLNQHYEKHGIEMGFDSPEEYEAAASAVIYNPDVLTKTEKDDGDYVFYVEDTNEFVVVSTDGFIRTYFLPDGGKAYFDRQ